ncbi:hypothetical protein AX15_002532 [Amanita polypyramis BW_CC]|nr:hypothetical protein AX15_002532 [Amanita polypyramis BW_CC]
MRRPSLKLFVLLLTGDAAHHRSKRSKDGQIIDVPYYQAQLPDPPNDPPRSPSPAKLISPLTRAASPSSSEYSCDSDAAPPQPRSPAKALKHTRRSSTLSDVGTDRRRLAIVQMETLTEGRLKAVSEHGHNSRSVIVPEPNFTGLAIVAPPDASPTTYTHLSPPASATGLDHARTRGKPKRANISAIQRPSSQPSSSVDSQNRPSTDKALEQHSSSARIGSIHPLNLRAAASSGSVNLHSPTVDQPITTPPIGQTKDVHVPVAGPVVVNLEPSRPLNVNSGNNKPSAPSIAVQSLSESPGKRNDIPYLQYQPGVHATAGPLPPPPRAAFVMDTGTTPPPRPPRMLFPNSRSRGDIEAVKQALQLPPSVSAALASRSSASPESTSSTSSPNSKSDSIKLPSIESSTSIEEGPEIKPSHRREGAFMPTPDLASIQISTSSSSSSMETTNTMEAKGSENIQENDQVLPRATEQVILVTPPPRHESLHTRDNVPNQEGTPSPVFVERPLSPDSVPGPSPPPKSFRNSMTSGLKRLSSISRTPSASSRSPKRISFDLVAPTRRKVVMQNPAALFCHEVNLARSASERCSIYIQKINDLYNCDTGLMDWLNDAKCRGSNSNVNIPSSLSTDPFTPQRRHTSGSSMMTDATFPRRPDATTATDLTPSHRNITPPTAQPPPLPYPSLAIPQQQQRIPRSSFNTGSSTPIISIRSLSPSTPTNALKGGFFASLGRRTSVSGRRDKPGIMALSPNNSQSGGGPTKAPQPQAAPRPINISASPSVPGGPRAPPNRMKRSQTLMSTPASFLTKPEAFEQKGQLTRRPSTHNLHHVVDDRPDPEFIRQVDRLADLLPHADRNVLAVYLRRAGQDILAIGQYLDDEKNGTLRVD